MSFIYLCVSGNVYTGTVDGKLWRISPDDRLTFITQMGQSLPECGGCCACVCENGYLLFKLRLCP